MENSAEIGCEGDNDLPRGCLTSLKSHDETGIVGLLQRRLLAGKIYTHGAWRSLVACNPYSFSPCVWDQRLLDSFKKPYELDRSGADASPEGWEDPHIWGLCRRGWHYLKQASGSISFAFQGESGSGKSEAAKHVALFFLTKPTCTTGINVAQAFRKNGHGVLDMHVLAAMADSGAAFSNVLMYASSLIEALTSAKTLRNDNSSRSCHLLRMHMRADGSIQAGEMRGCLFDSSRVVERAQGERNYHVFYQFVAGMSRQERDRYRIKTSTAHYFFLARSGCLEVSGVDDGVEWNAVVLPALHMIGLDYEGRHVLNSLLSSILLCGEIKWVVDEGSVDVFCATPDALEDLAFVLGVELKSLYAEMRRFRSNSVDTPRSLQQLKVLTDALAKSLFGIIFRWILHQINFVCKSSAAASSQAQWVAVLDIVGFEAFHVNSLEHLLINFAGEKLHQVFLKAAYKFEGVTDCLFEFEDNACLLELLDNPLTVTPRGVLTFLEQSCDEADDSFQQALLERCRIHPHPRFTESPPESQGIFEIVHSCGVVRYSTDKFSEKSKDGLPTDLLTFLKSSNNPALADVLERFGERVSCSIDTVRSCVSECTETVRNSHAYFVKCLRPNLWRKPLHLDSCAVSGQLHTLGVFDSLRNQESIATYRKPFHDFLYEHRALSIHSPKLCSLCLPNAGDMNPEITQQRRNLCAAMLESVYENTAAHILTGHTNFLLSQTEVLLSVAMRDRCAEMCQAAVASVVPTIKQVQLLLRAKEEADKYKDVTGKLQKTRLDAADCIYRAIRRYHALAAVVGLRRVVEVRNSIGTVAAAFGRSNAQNTVKCLRAKAAADLLRQCFAVRQARGELLQILADKAATTVQRHVRGFIGRREAVCNAHVSDIVACREVFAHLEAMRWRLRFADYKEKEGARMAAHILSQAKSLNKGSRYTASGSKRLSANNRSLISAAPVEAFVDRTSDLAALSALCGERRLSAHTDCRKPTAPPQVYHADFKIWMERARQETHAMYQKTPRSSGQRLASSLSWPESPRRPVKTQAPAMVSVERQLIKTASVPQWQLRAAIEVAKHRRNDGP